MKNIFIVFIWLTISQAVLAQKKIEIGGKVPNIPIKVIQGGKIIKSQLSSYLGKPIILDFWETHCVPCIQLMPELDKLQKKYAGKMNILLVTSEESSVILKFFNRPIFKNINLTCIVEDKLLKNFFPHNMIPTDAFLNKDGIFMGLADGQEIVEPKVKSFVENGVFDFKKKVTLPSDVVMGEIPFMVINDRMSRMDLTERYFYIGKNLDGSARRGRISTLDEQYGIKAGLQRIQRSHSTIIGLYKAVCANRKGNESLPEGRIVYDSLDSLYDEAKIPREKEEDKIYSMDVVLKDTSVLARIRLRNYGQRELDSFFGLESRLEKRKFFMYIIRKKFDSPLLNAHQSTTDQIQEFKANDTLHYVNSLWGRKCEVRFNNVSSLPNIHYQIIDETGFSKQMRFNMDIPLSAFNDSEELSRVFEKYGLSITKEIRWEDCIVLRKQDHQSLGEK